jgi:hypothetical protein
VALKQNGWVKHLTLVVAAFCIIAFVMTLFLPNHVKEQGRQNEKL